MRFLVAALAALIASSHAVTVETSGGLSVSPCAVCKSLLGNDVFTPCEATKSKEKQEKKDADAAFEDTGDFVIPEAGSTQRFCTGAKDDKKVVCHNNKICLKTSMGSCEGGSKLDCTETTCAATVAECSPDMKKKDKAEFAGCCFDPAKDCEALSPCDNKRNELLEKCGVLMQGKMCNATLSKGDPLKTFQSEGRQTAGHNESVDKVFQLIKELTDSDEYNQLINKVAANNFMVKHDVDARINKAIVYNLPTTTDDMNDADREQNPDCRKIPSDCQHGSTMNLMSCSCDACVYPWTGEFCDTCPKTEADCGHNGTLNTELCVCEQCDHPWSGEKCNKCMREQLQCRHGGVLDIVGSCRCDNCKWPWGGDLCEDCLRKETDCMNTGTWNPLLCMCEHCPEPWEGDLCEHCTLDQPDCEHKGVINMGTCSCDSCDYVWVGRLCEVCPRTQADCMHGGRLDPTTCKCIWCEDPWIGDLCETCGRNQGQCVHGTLKSLASESCTCEGGPTGELGAEMNANLWSGPFLEKCMRLQRDCVHGGTMNKELCVCEQCSHNYWAGDLCNKCLRNTGQCKHGSTLNLLACKCGAHHWRHVTSCPTPWTGDFCGQCTGKCVHGKNGNGNVADGGSFSPEECICKECEYPWSGRWCEICSVHPNDCKHQSMLSRDASKCECEGGDEPWRGRLRSTCPLTAADCAHNSVLNLVTCDCEMCRYPWDGGQTTKAPNDLLRVGWGTHAGKQVKWVRKAADNGIDQVVDLDGTQVTIPDGYLKYADAAQQTTKLANHFGGGSTCTKCRRNVGDCLHASSTVDLETCKCVCPNPAVWNGDSCEVCTVTKYDCLYGSFFEKAQCKCKQCGADFAGVTAGKCNKCGFTCKNGATQDAGTCACSCAAGWQGKDCGEASCPALNGKMCNGHGSCVASGIAHCQCNGGWGGADCGGTNTNNGHCHSVGDPHPQNMDGCTFDWYNDGEIVFYKDVDGWEEDQINLISTRYSSVAGNTGFAWKRRGADGRFSHIKFMGSGNSKAMAVQYCNNEGACRKMSGGNHNTQGGWMTLPNGLKYMYDGGGYKIESPDGLVKAYWNSWWGPPYQRLNVYLNINRPKGGADGICGRNDPSHKLKGCGGGWRNNLGMTSRNSGEWWRDYNPQNGGTKYPVSLFDAGGNCPFSVNAGNYGTSVNNACGVSYNGNFNTAAAPPKFVFSPHRRPWNARFQQVKDDDDDDSTAAATQVVAAEETPILACPLAVREMAVKSPTTPGGVDAGVCHSTCASEQNMAPGAQLGDQCWNCINDFCTSGDPGTASNARDAIGATKAGTAAADQAAQVTGAVGKEEEGETALDQQRIDQAKADGVVAAR